MKHCTILYLEVHILDLHDLYNDCECDADRAEIEADIKTVGELIEWLKTVNS
jgi:hypothetical protein